MLKRLTNLCKSLTTKNSSRASVSFAPRESVSCASRDSDSCAPRASESCAPRDSESFSSRASESFSSRDSESFSSRASESCAPRESVSSALVKSFKSVLCYIQEKDLRFVKCNLSRDNVGEIPNFTDFKQLIFRQSGIPDIIVLFKKMPSFDEIRQIAVLNGFKTPMGLQTIEIEEYDTLTIIFNIHTDFNKELSKYYVIFEDDKVEVTLNLGLSLNCKDVVIHKKLTEVKQTLFLQNGHIKYILQFDKKLTSDQYKIVLNFLNINCDNHVEQVAALKYYKECTNEELKKTYISKGGSIEFDYGVIQLTEILPHGSILLGIDNTIGRCHLESVLSENSCENHREDLEATNSEMIKAVSEKNKNVKTNEISASSKGENPNESSVSASSKGENPNESSVSASSNVDNPNESSVSASSNVDNPNESSVSASSNVDKPYKPNQKEKLRRKKEIALQKGFYNSFSFKI
jgi:hypothetical protein